MQLKTNLHLHTKEDPEDEINYTAQEAIDEASRLGFEALALTLHNKFGYTKELSNYASAKNILLISGIEKTIEGRHVLILNCDASIEKVFTFEDLFEYKKSHYGIFIIAPHPYYVWYSLGAKFDEYRELFDAIEQSWFYTNFFNLNVFAKQAAEYFNFPLIATSDTHFIQYLDNSYALIEAEEKSAHGIFKAIRNKNFQNISKPARFWQDMIKVQGRYTLKDIKKRLLALRTGKNFRLR